jgi:hypothetical protein
MMILTGCPTNTAVDNSKAIIVAVDGLSFVNTLVGTTLEKSNDYLQTNIGKLIKSPSIRQFHWNGDGAQTSALLASSDVGLRKFLRDNYQEARDKNKAFIVICHSWGTMLSYLALSLEPQIRCDLFITLSCPLGTASGLPSSPEQIVRDYADARLAEISFNVLGTSYPNAKVFYNFRSYGDVISGPLSGKIPTEANVIDVQVDQGISDLRDVPSTYFWHKYLTLGDEVVDGSDPSYSIYTTYLLSVGIININPRRNEFVAQVVSLIQTASGY